MSGHFKNRKDAGVRLSKKLMGTLNQADTQILALPRGGVPVAFEVSRALRIPMDVLVVRKIGAPFQPEYGIGALTEDGYHWIDEDAVRRASIETERVAVTLLRERAEVEKRVRRYRQGKPLPSLEGKTVLLVDDGLATGVTARVAANYARRKGARKVILAVPVCAPEAVEHVQKAFDEIVCLEKPPFFFSVGQFYQDFDQLSDEEVVHFLSLLRSENQYEVCGRSKPRSLKAL